MNTLSFVATWNILGEHGWNWEIISLVSASTAINSAPMMQFNFSTSYSEPIHSTLRKSGSVKNGLIGGLIRSTGPKTSGVFQSESSLEAS